MPIVLKEEKGTRRKIFSPPHHFVERALERLGVIMTPELYTELLEAIWYRRSELVRNDHSGRSVHLIEAHGERFFVSYDPDEGGVLVTCFHRGWFKKNELGHWETAGSKQKAKFTRRQNRSRTLEKKYRRKVGRNDDDRTEN